MVELGENQSHKLKPVPKKEPRGGCIDLWDGNLTGPPGGIDHFASHLL